MRKVIGIGVRQNLRHDQGIDILIAATIVAGHEGSDSSEQCRRPREETPCHDTAGSISLPDDKTIDCQKGLIRRIESGNSVVLMSSRET